MASAATRVRELTNKNNAKPKAAPAALAISRYRKPEALTAIEWRRALRRRLGRDQNFTFKNLGDRPIFSKFSVVNPAVGKYRVVICGDAPEENFCGCADFATNRLGTCQHVDLMLATLAKGRGGTVAFQAGFALRFSEAYVHYLQRRSLGIRIGVDCHVALRKYF